MKCKNIYCDNNMFAKKGFSLREECLYYQHSWNCNKKWQYYIIRLFFPLKIIFNSMKIIIKLFDNLLDYLWSIGEIKVINKIKLQNNKLYHKNLKELKREMKKSLKKERKEKEVEIGYLKQSVPDIIYKQSGVIRYKQIFFIIYWFIIILQNIKRI